MKRFKQFLIANGAWIGLLVLVVAFSVLTHGDFFSPRNLTNLMRQASINGILAGGMTLVILSGGIDLSIGSTVALAGVLVGIGQLTWGWTNTGLTGAFESLGIALVAGTLAGFVNGALVAWLRIAPFVITLGMMVIARGLAMIFSGGAAISPVSEVLTSWAGNYLGPVGTLIAIAALILPLLATVARRKNPAILFFPLAAAAVFAWAFFVYRGLPTIALFMLGTLGVLAFMLTYTVFGRSVYAIGSNERAAYFAGVRIRPVILGVYSLMGLLAGLAGFLLTSRLNGADPNAGQLFELDAIAAVVIGGTSLKGGSGSVAGSFVGALTIATLNNGMDILGISSFYQMVFKGVIIILAVSLDQGQRKKGY
ncbi:MAG: sugar ABC transporter permease [Bdellovibrionota bacterium]